MTTARKYLVDPSVTRYYHTISRCARQLFLCGDGNEHRKQWVEDRLERLTKHFAISVAGFSVMDNHLHVLIRLDPEEAREWTAEQVLRRWLAIYPPRNMALEDPAVVQMWLDHHAKDTKKVELLRERLGDLGWFMKALKEPIARMANREDECKGAFWEARYKSIAILDEESLLATCAYIDLNPLAAGIASTPETSKHTSIRQRLSHVKRQGKLSQLKAASRGSVAGSKAAGNIEQAHWLLPIEDRRSHTNAKTTSTRAGMLESFSLGSYVLLVDYTARLFRNGKARMDKNVADVFSRLGIGIEFWNDRIKKMLSSRSLHGSFFTRDREKLRELAAKQGRHHLANLTPQLPAVA